MMRTEEYEEWTAELEGFGVRFSTYRIGNRHHCHVSNLDPGATIARAEGASREKALDAATAKARERLQVFAHRNSQRLK